MATQYLLAFLTNLWLVSLEAAPWLLFGLIVAGLIKVWLPVQLMQRFLGGRGLVPILNAAILGTPLPLCSCSVIPAAIALRRSGASKEATVSFFVATPENGADSIALSYAMLGPFMAIVRPVAAIFSAILAGAMTWLLNPVKQGSDLTAATTVTTNTPVTAEANEVAKNPLAIASPPAASCCSSKACCATEAAATTAVSPKSWRAKLTHAFQFAIDDLFGDIALWLGIGLLLAALVNTFVSPGAMGQWGSGLGAMLLMLVVGVPMYTCATASTPLAAAMIAAGVSPGVALVFLLAGPATNIGTIFIVKRELGLRTCVAYLAGVCGGALISGLLVDWIVGQWQISISAQVAHVHDVVPFWIAAGSLVVLLLMTLRLYTGSLFRAMFKKDVAEQPG